jgi:hypothetical protein
MRADIRCPKCGFEPPPQLQWGCFPDGCGYIWNTFATHGVCPRCRKFWHDTACPRCHMWSPHDDWYPADVSERNRQGKRGAHTN